MDRIFTETGQQDPSKHRWSLAPAPVFRAEPIVPLLKRILRAAVRNDAMLFFKKDLYSDFINGCQKEADKTIDYMGKGDNSEAEKNSL